ncbi:hypothetical protein [Streptomyces graminilatus]|uniref:hypothetical protein n=1 Tax=Streptomyces graminilatus TaxID=1464070 RepID=UPI0012FE818E|nr:hypothetical protein [Streptomyces graminilatus]
MDLVGVPFGVPVSDPVSDPVSLLARIAAALQGARCWFNSSALTPTDENVDQNS